MADRDQKYLDAIEKLMSEGRTDDAKFLMERLKAEQAARAPKPSPKPVTAPVSRPARKPEPTVTVGEIVRREPVEAAQSVAPLPALPKTPPPRATVEFRQPEELEEEARRAIEAQALTAAGEKIPTALIRPVAEEEAAIAQRLFKEQQRARGAVVQPGKETPTEVTEGGGPLFRPTEIRVRQTYRIPAPMEGGGTYVPKEQLPATLDPASLETRIERMIRDEATGDFRTPTAWDEFAESFANQPVLTEMSAREQERQLALEQAARDKGYYGETPWYDQPGSLLSEIFEKPDVEGRGAVETDLAAGLRSFLSYASAAAAEGYFAGLGYEVDPETGYPKDPNDWGYALAQMRESVGIPEVLMGVPLPGMATTREGAVERKFDPEGRRVVEQVQEGQDYDYWKRVAQNVAKGRTWGDELLSTPASKQWFLTNTGDPDHAYLAGLAVEVLMPAGPELVAGPLGWAAGAAADVSRLGGKFRQIKALKAAEKTLEEARLIEKAADANFRRLAQIAPEGSETLEKAGTALRVAQDGVDEASAGVQTIQKALIEGFDPTLAASVTKKAARAAGATDDQQKALSAALKAKKPVTADDLFDAMTDAGIVGPKQEAIHRLVAQNLPADLVALTDDIAVPRSLLGEAQKILKRNRKELFRYDDYTKAAMLRDAAKALPAGKARDAALKVAEDALSVLNKEAKPPGGVGRIAAALGLPETVVSKVTVKPQVLPKPMGRALDSAARALTKEAGTGTDYVRLINERSPAEVFQTIGGPFLQEMTSRGYQTWDDVPADVRRQLTTMWDIHNIDDYGDLARLSRDLTRAQMTFESAEKGNLFRNSKFFSAQQGGLTRRAVQAVRKAFPGTDNFSAYSIASRAITDALFDPDGLRRLRMKAWIDPQLYRETALVARASKELEQAAGTVIRTYGQRLQALARETGSVNRAVERLTEDSIRKAGGDATEAWDTILDALYGGEVKNRLTSRLINEADDRWQDLKIVKSVDPETGKVTAEFTEFPTIEQVKRLDRHYADTDVLPGVGGKGPLAFITSGDIQMAFIKAGVENGLKKEILANKRLTQQVAAMQPDRGTFFAGQLGQVRIRPTDIQLPLFNPAPISPAAAEKLARSQFANPVAGSFGRLPDYMEGLLGPRYTALPGDTINADILNTGGEALFKMLEGVPVRQRGYIDSNIVDNFFGKIRRNGMQRWNQGYIVPRMIPFTERLATTYIVPMTTIGPYNALKATLTQVSPETLKRAYNSVRKRRVYGGGIETPSGEYLSPKMLEDMANEYGIGITRLESQRVGSLANDIRNDARAAAMAGDGSVMQQEAAKFLFNELNPGGRGYWVSLADGIERNYRKSVFEMALAAGETPSNAAALARRSNFDLAATPTFLRDQAARYFGNTGFLYHAGAKALETAVENPYAIQSVLKAHREAAKYKDPFNVQGDKAIKSLGQVNVGGKDYYLPANPAFIPIEVLIGSARAGDKILDDIRFAAQTTDEGMGQVLAGGEAALLGGMGAVAQVAGEVVLPGAFEAYDRFQKGEAYKSQDVPDAEPMSDEKMYWAMALAANARDPYHETNGAWAALTSVFPHKQLDPPAGLADPSDPTGKAWLAQPPEGVPHILWEPAPGELPRYYAFEPTEETLRRIRLLRTATADGLGTLGITPLASTFIASPTDPEADQVYLEGRLPETPAEAVTQQFLSPVGDRRAAQVQQRQLMKEIREDIPEPK